MRGLSASHQTDQTLIAYIAEEAGANEYAEEAEEEEGLGPRQSSGLSHLEYGADDIEANKVRKNRRQIKASGRAVGKTNRRRRLDEEDEQAEEARATRKRKRGQACICDSACFTLVLHSPGICCRQTAPKLDHIKRAHPAATAVGCSSIERALHLCSTVS